MPFNELKAWFGTFVYKTYKQPQYKEDAKSHFKKRNKQYEINTM